MLEQLIMHYEEGNKTRFARRLGISPQGVSTWLSRGTIDYELIYAKCENINADWLLSGEGTMLRADSTPTVLSPPSTDASTPSDAIVLRLMDKLDEKDTLLKDKESKIDQLQSELRAMEKELATLKAQLSQYQPENKIHQPEAGDLEGKDPAKNVYTKKHSLPDADNATSAIVP